MSDWIEWSGGECPVVGNVYVEVKWRNLKKYEDYAVYFLWEHRGGANDVIAYRVL